MNETFRLLTNCNDLALKSPASLATTISMHSNALRDMLMARKAREAEPNADLNLAIGVATVMLQLNHALTSAIVTLPDELASMLLFEAKLALQSSVRKAEDRLAKEA